MAWVPEPIFKQISPRMSDQLKTVKLDDRGSVRLVEGVPFCAAPHATCHAPNFFYHFAIFRIKEKKNT